MSCKIFHLSDIPIEQAHGGTGARQMLVKPEHLTTSHVEAVTKGFIPVGNMFDWHNHIDTDEVFIVTQGQGKFFYRENNDEKQFEYKADDVIIAPANIFHKILSEGDIETQGFFFRIKTK
jgi:mannose-6-phosphate isomerase-like protein (cupin superfamily)